MKGKFLAYTNLMQIETVLREHKPYAVMAVSTTGLDNNNFSEHSPTRVVLKEFEYNEALNSYNSTINFDKMVKAPQSAVDKAIDNANSYDTMSQGAVPKNGKDAVQQDGACCSRNQVVDTMSTTESDRQQRTAHYDVFANGGIDRDKYIAGEGVLSVDDFQKEFASVISALKEDGSTLIINGDCKFAETYLGKIGCADGIAELSDKGMVVEQTRMTQEYFGKTGIVSKTAKLEDLKNAITVSPNGSFYKDKSLMADFRSMTKDDFLKAHPDITESKYALTQRDAENREGKIIGGDNRISVINNFVTKYGRDEKLLVSEWQEQQKEAEAAMLEDMSERGKAKYKNGDLDDKFNTLIEQGTLKPDDISEGKSEFHKLINAIENKDNKGVIIIHAASTGFENGRIPQSTGFPIQFTALVFKRDENGRLNMRQVPNGANFNIEAPSKSFQNAIKNINDPKRPYNTFKETGIDLEDYKAKKGVFSADDATERVNKFFKKFSIEDYALIAIGGTKGSNYSFTQTCMSNLGNFAMCEAGYIDFAQAVKDYSYLAHTDDKYPKNAIVDEFAFENNGDAAKPKTFSVRDIAEARGDKRPASTQEMCLETAKLIYLMEQQQIELFRPEELTVSSEPRPIVKKAEEDEKKAAANVAADKSTKQFRGEETFADEGNVDAVTTEEFLGFSKTELAAVAPRARQDVAQLRATGDNRTLLPLSQMGDRDVAQQRATGGKSLKPVPSPESEKPLKTTRSVSALLDPPRDRQSSNNGTNAASRTSARPMSPRPFRATPTTSDDTRFLDDEPIFDEGESIGSFSSNARTARPMDIPPRFRNEGTPAQNETRATRPRFGNPANSIPRNNSDRVENKPKQMAADDVSRLLDVIEKQNATILEMNNRLASIVEQTTERLSNVVECQDELMKTVVQVLSDRTEGLEKGDSFRETNDELGVAERLEGIIGVIDNVRENVPTNRAQTHLMNAKQALDSAVNEINRAVNEKNQRTAS